MSFAEIKNYNGQPTIMINNKPYPAMAMTTKIEKPDYLKSLGKAGIKIFFIMTNTTWLRPGYDYTDEKGVKHHELSGYEKFCRDAKLLLECVPDAWIMVRIGLHPPVDWVKSHPEDIVSYNDGTMKEALVRSEVHRDLIPGMYSLCSENWRKDGAKALNDFCNSVEDSPYADRVIGYFLAAGGTSEWYYINPLEYPDEGIYADTSPAFSAEFGKFLKEKYKSEDALKKSWCDKNASFASPRIPDLEGREYIDIDDDLQLLMKEQINTLNGEKIPDENMPCSSIYNSTSSNEHTNDKNNIGVFLNPDTNQITADFYRALHLGTANSIISFAKVIKDNFKGKLVGAFYGSYGNTDHYDASTAGGTLKIMDSGYLDFLAAPGDYYNREPGGYVTQREMQDSFRLRNQIFMVEEDSRTHLESDFYRDLMQIYNVEDSINTLKRDFGRNLCEEVHGWWFDQHKMGGRYDDPDIFRLFSRQQEIAEKAIEFDRVKKNEIAVIYDQESLHYVSRNTNTVMLDYYRATDLNRIGAPVDYYFHNDMQRDDMPDYKVYIMINLFYISDEEREIIHKKAAKNNATVIWLYAQGIINPDHDKKFDLKNIKDLTGFNICQINKSISPCFFVDKKDITKYAVSKRRYGYTDREIHSNLLITMDKQRCPFVNPFFYIDDKEAETLGKYFINNKTALAVKKYKGFNSIYCGAQVLRSELIASVAEYSGCHLYTHNDDCIYANENFITIHAKKSGKRKLYFKKTCSPFEVYEKRFYANNVSEIELDMDKGETLMFCVSDKMPSSGI